MFTNYKTCFEPPHRATHVEGIDRKKTQPKNVQRMSLSVTAEDGSFGEGFEVSDDFV